MGSTHSPAQIRSQAMGVWMLAAGQTLVWAGLFYIFAALLLSWEIDFGCGFFDFTERRTEHYSRFCVRRDEGASFGLISILKPPVIAETLGRTGYGVISGWLAMPYLIGGAIGPYFGAVLYEFGGYSTVLWATVSIALLGFALILALIRIGQVLLIE